MHVRTRPVTALVVALSVGLTVHSSAQDRFKGRMLADALQDLQARGLRLVFSSDVVTPRLRVAREPESSDPHEMLAELLRAHDLEARPGPGGILQVVKAPAPRAPAAQNSDRSPARSDPAEPQRLPHVERVTVWPPHADADRPGPPARVTATTEELRLLSDTLADDPLRGVHSLPHVAASDDFASEFSVRASPFRHIGIVVDGVATPWLIHTAYGRGRTGSVTMLGAEVVREASLEAGAYPQRHGDHLGAQLSLDIREGSRDEMRLSGSVSSTNVGVAGEGPLGGSGRGSWLLAMRQSYRDWPSGRLSEFPGTVFGYADLTAKLAYEIAPEQKVTVTLLGGRTSIDEPDDGGRLPLADGWNQTNLVSVAWQSLVSPRLVLKQRASLVAHSFLNEDPSGARRDRGSDTESSYRIDVTRTLGRGLIEAGGHVGRQRGAREDGGSLPAMSAATVARSFQRAWWSESAYAHWRWSVTPRLSVAPGIRVTASTLSPQPVVGRWLLGEWRAHANWTLKGSAGVAYQFPSAAWLALAGDGLVGDPERARYADIGVEHRLSPAMQWRATVFHRREQDVLRGPDSTPRIAEGFYAIPPFADALDRLSGEARGVELQIERASPTGLSGWISYAYGTARYRDPVRNETFWADFDQRHTISAFGVYQASKRLRLSGRLRVGSNYPVTGYVVPQGGAWQVAPARNAARLPTYSRLDLRVDRVLRMGERRLTLFAEVINVLDHGNVGRANSVFLPGGAVTHVTEPLYPRLPSVGVRVDW